MPLPSPTRIVLALRMPATASPVPRNTHQTVKSKKGVGSKGPWPISAVSDPPPPWRPPLSSSTPRAAPLCPFRSVKSSEAMIFPTAEITPFMVF